MKHNERTRDVQDAPPHTHRLLQRSELNNPKHEDKNDECKKAECGVENDRTPDLYCRYEEFPGQPTQDDQKQQGAESADHMSLPCDYLDPFTLFSLCQANHIDILS